MFAHLEFCQSSILIWFIIYLNSREKKMVGPLILFEISAFERRHADAYKYALRLYSYSLPKTHVSFFPNSFICCIYIFCNTKFVLIQFFAH